MLLLAAAGTASIATLPVTLDSHGDDHAVVFGVNVGVLDGPDAFERFADRFLGAAPRALGR